MSVMTRTLLVCGLKINIIFSYILLIQCELNFNNDFENNKNFKSVPTTVKTFENDTVLLPCYHTSTLRYVRWHRDDVHLVDSRHPEISPPENIHLFPNGSLQVSNVQAEDTGDYYCEIMSSESHAVQVHAIEVQYSPSIYLEPSGRLIELPIGAIFELICESKGVPQPAITWRHNDNILEKYHVGNRQNLLVEIKDRSMSGTYECLATNGVGNPAVANINLNVLFEPEIKILHNVVYTKIGARAHLECFVDSAPAATVFWYHHGVPIVVNQRLTRHDTDLQVNRTTGHYHTESKHTLVIKKVRDSDLGLYECRAENKIGYKGTSIDLTGRPMQCIFKINPGVQSSTSHTLVWQTESLSQIMEFKLKFRQIPSGTTTPQSQDTKLEWAELTIPSDLSDGPIHTTSYTLRGLQPASIYEVSVLARNHFGWSDNSKIVRFATGGEVELPNYSTESAETHDGEDDEIVNEITHTSQMFSTKGHNHSPRLLFPHHIGVLLFIVFTFSSLI